MTRCVVAVDADIAWVTLDGARRRNALDAQFWGQFADALDALDAAAPRAVVLTGAGDVFCAGGDVARMRDSVASMGDGTFEASERARMEHIDELLLRWAALPVPRIGAVNGAAVGAGLAFAASCDYALAAEGAFFDTGFARLGLPGDMGVTYYLARAVGARTAAQWLLRARRVDAAEAARSGLVDDVVAAEDLLGRAREVAEGLAAGSPVAAAFVLHRAAEVTALERALDHERDATLAAKQSAFHREAVDRFFATSARP